MTIRFVLRYASKSSYDACIYARITICKKRAEICTGKTIHPSAWDAKRQRTSGTRDIHAALNAHLDDVEFRIREALYQLKKQNSIITPGLVKQVFLGEKVMRKTLMALFEYHRDAAEPLLRPGTAKNYISTRRYLLKFLKEQYRTDDMLLSELNYEFISRFDQFLRKTVPLQKGNVLSNNGIMKHMERLKKIATLGYKLNWINRDPFILYKLKFQRFERQFLNEEELYRLQSVELKSRTGNFR